MWCWAGQSMQSLHSLVGVAGTKGGQVGWPVCLWWAGTVVLPLGSSTADMYNCCSGGRTPRHSILIHTHKRHESSISSNQVTGRKWKFIRAGDLAGEHTADDFLFNRALASWRQESFSTVQTQTKGSNHTTHYLLVPHSAFPPSAVWDVFSCSR